MSQPSSPHPMVAVPDARRRLVAEAARAWQGQLVDLSARNTLLYYRDLKAGTLDLGNAGPAALGALLDGRTVALSRLHPDPEAYAAAGRRARTIRNKARELAEERGLQSCFLVSGMVTWTNTKGTATPAAPLLLRPATVTARTATEDDFDLTLTGDPEINPTLLHLLRTDFGVEVDAERLLDLLPDDDADLEPLATHLIRAAGAIPGFAVTTRQVLGTFSYAKLPMVNDLQTAEDALVTHDVVAAIAGDQAAAAQVRGGGGAVDPQSPDKVPPTDEFVVVDADSSQNYAVNAVLAGQNVVVEGPPGTGKSQTIANLISTLVARGRRVLFVAEKQVAITAVTDRLVRHGLGGLVLDVHDQTVSRARILGQLKAALDAASQVPRPQLAALHQRLIDRRGRVGAHAAAMHRRHPPWDLSLYEVQNALTDLRQRYGDAVTTPIRIGGPTLTALDADACRRIRDDLREYAILGGLRRGSDPSPWAGATVVSAEQAQHALDTVHRVTGQVLPAARSTLHEAVHHTGLSRPTTLAGWQQTLALLDEVAALLSTVRIEVFGGPLAEAVAAAAPGRWRRQHPEFRGGNAGFWERRRRRRQARDWWRADSRPGRRELFEALQSAHQLAERWRSASADGGTPRLPADHARVVGAYRQLSAELEVLQGYLPDVAIDALTADEIDGYLRRLAADEDTIRKLPRRRALAAGLSRFGLDPLITELRNRPMDPDTSVAAFDHCWHASIRSHIGFTDAHVGGFDGAVHDRTSAEYREVDRQHLHTTAERVRRAVAENIVAIRNAHPEESQLVEHQARLKRRHLPVRQLFQAAPHMLTALKPCWAMSPLVVSQLLPADRQYFDVVVFDEASQVRPADAIPAILRARQIVVAGDRHQLPPTDFFTSRDDGEGAALGLGADGYLDLAMTSGYESILDVLSALLRCYTLQWHYRSRDERLIGFSNARIYDRSLVTFPGVTGAECLSHELVPQRPTAAGQAGSGQAVTRNAVAGHAVAGQAVAGQAESATAEVERVVALMLQHAASRPQESLGVITMGIKHAERIDAELRQQLADRPDLQPFFAQSGVDRPFVKNLERVQGDERDAIILSIGYGKDANGRLPYRFGPLLLAGGERRLNVAVTRARRRMTLVSSFGSADMDPGRSRAEGVRLLRAYLQYAESGGTNLGDVAVPKPALNPFERDVRDRLTAAGIPLTPQYGVAGYFIDFAAAHPAQPGRMVLAIEADGATYHSSTTARDRDRLRQEQLERLGWTFHRIWSTSWFTDPAGETDRAVQAYERAVAAADTPPRPAVTGGQGYGAVGGADVDPVAAPATAAPATAGTTGTDTATPGAATAGTAAPGAVGTGVQAPDDEAPAGTGPGDDAPQADGPHADAPQLGTGAAGPSTAPAGRSDGGRGPAPGVRAGRSITEYSSADLVAVVRWVESDTLLRTDEELLSEVMRTLGFKRRGTRIVGEITAAIRATRRP